MTRFAKIYEAHKKRKAIKDSSSKINTLNREGYGYIKRRVGLLSNEVQTPTYLAVDELFEIKD